MNLVESLNWRYATKKFDSSKTVDSDVFTRIMESTNLTATSLGLQAYNIIVVTNSELKNKLVEASYGQTKVAEASHFVIFAARTDINENYIEKYVNYAGEIRKMPSQEIEGFKQMVGGFINHLDEDAKINWASKQCYIALGTLLTACATEKVDSCPMEGFVADKFDEILGLKAKNLKSVVAAAVGFRSNEDFTQNFKKIRKPLSEMVIEFK